MSLYKIKNMPILQYINSTFFFLFYPSCLLSTFFPFDIFSSRRFFYLLINVLTMSAFFLWSTLCPIDVFYFSKFVPVDIFHLRPFVFFTVFSIQRFVPFVVFFLLDFLSVVVFYRRPFLLRRFVGESRNHPREIQYRFISLRGIYGGGEYMEVGIEQWVKVEGKKIQ